MPAAAGVDAVRGTTAGTCRGMLMSNRDAAGVTVLELVGFILGLILGLTDNVYSQQKFRTWFVVNWFFPDRVHRTTGTGTTIPTDMEMAKEKVMCVDFSMKEVRKRHRNKA